MPFIEDSIEDSYAPAAHPHQTRAINMKTPLR